MYFETGQGSALSANAHHGVDQLTLEARAYGVARVFDPFLVNSVVGFIGPEYLYDERQIVQPDLEDHFMGKLLGLPMGCDVCYTNHAAADQNSTDNLLLLLGTAGCNYFMGVPCSDDVMLNYQTTSYHDAIAVRRLFNLNPAPEFLNWLQETGIYHGVSRLSLTRRGDTGCCEESRRRWRGLPKWRTKRKGIAAANGQTLFGESVHAHRRDFWPVGRQRRTEPIPSSICGKPMPRHEIRCALNWTSRIPLDDFHRANGDSSTSTRRLPTRVNTSCDRISAGALAPHHWRRTAKLPDRKRPAIAIGDGLSVAARCGSSSTVAIALRGVQNAWLESRPDICDSSLPSRHPE